ncbi:hypothetical protein ACEPAG_4226 [Sanghuangporus baumii]
MNSLPSPAVSNDNSPHNSPSTPLNNSRKRARSYGSEASHSKRAMSEDPSPSSAVEPPQSSASSPEKIEDDNEGIDAYMREQGEQNEPFEAPVRSVASSPGPSPAEKYQLINKLKSRTMQPGELWYIVSRSWFRKWEKACLGEVDKEGAVLEDQLGPVDNSSFFKNGKFDTSQSMIEGVNVEFVPEDAWNELIQWYGSTPDVIPRQVITRGFNHEATLELRPPYLRIFRLIRDSSSIKDSPIYHLTISSQARLSDLYAKLLDTFDVPRQSRFRTWVLENADVDGAYISAPKLLKLLKDEGRLLPSDERSTSKTVDESLIQSNDALVVELPDNETWPVDEMSIHRASSSSVDATNSPDPIFSSGSDFFSKLSTSSDKTTAPQSSQLVPSGPSLPAQASSSHGKGKPDRKGIVPGTIGFSNMGNTCFMNSALQCLAHAQELVEYFLTGVYLNELNPDNPLGMQGAIAEAFGALLINVWQPRSSVYAPREFKMQLQRFAPQFSGYQQHDSQELVAFLLDGLHEDLNRVLKKPYVEKPDWNGGGDKELVLLAKESWEGYKKRNDSVIVDLFQGQYRSTLICPECNKISITFDPFMYLTLPLPIQKKWSHTILYIPWDVTKPHVKVPVEVGRNATFKEVRQLLGRWMKTDADNLLTLELFSNRFYKYLDDTVPVNEMSDADHIVCFELPCHAQQSRNWIPSEDPAKNKLILPVHLCKEIPSSHSSFHRPSSGFAHPFIVVLDYEQHRDRKKIYAAIVERIERWTKHSRDLYRWEEVSTMEEIQIQEPPPKTSLTEIKENGDVVTVEEDLSEESDMTNERHLVLENEIVESASGERILNRLEPKPDLFEMHIQSGHDKLGAGSAWTMGKWERWEAREKSSRDGENALLYPGDAIYCEWDDNFRSYFFGDEPQYEHALWAESHWGEFIHPEFKEMREASSSRSKKHISLTDCLEEFTKEEQLGEDDLWYCPQCKKHQQATKKFDVWTIPDILVVHLKRFSNSRILRDKIDAFVDFPIDGLDLTDYSGEREVAKRLAEEGQDITALGLSGVEEALIYDLFAVDEHMGGLGGGHYRAYAKNHETGTWYHFDDTHVSPAQPTEGVNANAYLLFYKRRTTRPIGGKTFEKVNEARQKLLCAEAEEVKAEVQLPTPPDDEVGLQPKNPRTGPLWLRLNSSPSPSAEDDENAIEIESDLENEPPSFEGPQLEDIRFPGDSLDANDTFPPDPFSRATRSYSFPNPESMTASPASSNAADAGGDTPDMDFEDLDDDNTTQDESKRGTTGIEIPVSESSLHDIDL